MSMLHEKITLPRTGVILETYLAGEAETPTA